jgi:hypothetical protein
MSRASAEFDTLRRMYVRWQLYRSQARDRRLREHKRARLKAILVESVRVDGKPVQKHIAVLGSTSIDGGDRPQFWYEVTTQLRRLSNRISPQDRERIGEAIGKKVGGRLLTKAELAKFRRRRAELLRLK